ncbi:hypothetical protein CSHISOI_10632, partial [Colletotrichum shisoi]
AKCGTEVAVRPAPSSPPRSIPRCSPPRTETKLYGRCKSYVGYILLPPPTTPHYVSNGTRRSSLETDVGLASGQLRSHPSEDIRSRRPHGIVSAILFLFSTQALCVLVRLKPPTTFKRPPAPGMTGAPYFEERR